MARTMKKFSAGGAQGRYERRMADIEKDFKKAMARKTGKDAEVAEAKRQQRIADAKDDLAKRTGADRTATRTAERLAESNLTKTRKYGAPKAVTTEASVSQPKITDTLGAITAPKSGLATTAKKPVQKPAQKAADKPKPSAADLARAKAALGASNAPSDQGFSRKSKVLGSSKATKTEPLKTGTGNGTSRLARAADPKDTSATASRARFGAALSYLNPFSYVPKGASFEERAEAARRQAKEAQGKAKGGTVKKEKTMKYAKGGSTSSRPTPKKPMPKEPITGGSSTVPLTPERKEFLKELAKRNAKPGMAKGGKATKFGKALVKKSADTMGRAMVKKACGGSMKKYASGGSVSSASKRADGCAVKGKTKGTMLARGGAAKMRGRDNYGGAEFKKGGSC